MEARRDENDSDARYRARYKLLRKTTKQLVYENAAMCNEINRLEERTVSAKVQRKFLLKKLFQLEKPEQRGNGEKNQRRTNLVQGLSNSKTSSIQNEPTTAKTENDENKIDNASQVLQVT